MSSIKSIFQDKYNLLYSNRFTFFTFSLWLLIIFDLTKPSSSENYIDFQKNSTYDLGFSEKGFYMGKAYYFDKNSFEFGLNYLNSQIGEFKPLSQNSEPLIYSSKGISLAYLRYFKYPIMNSGPFLKLKLDINTLNFHTRIRMNEHTYSLDKVNLTCRSCPDLKINTDDSIKYIPSLSIGWSHSFDDNLFFNLGFGLQYLNVNNIEWKLLDNSELPYFANEKINQILDEFENTFLDKYKILPHLELKIAYRF